MTTKAQEMKALEQIRKIVEGLGAESYVGKAFDGCFDMAQENIECDFWNSYKEKYNTAMDRATEKLTTLTGENEALKKRAEDAERLYNMAQKHSDGWLAKYHEAADIATENWNKFREQEDKVEDLENQIIRLKARLFDMMEAQGA